MRVLNDVQLAQKNDLMERLSEGKIDPPQAELEADQLGFGPLEEKPDPAQFDPMRKPYWSIPMGLGWIIWRDLAEVRELDNEYREECTYFRWFNVKVPLDGGATWRKKAGWELVRLWPVTTDVLPLMVNPEQCGAAQSELWEVLQEGKVIAHGIRLDGQIVDIPSREWVYLEAREQDRREYFGLRHEPFSRAYTDVLLRRAEVLARWPVCSVPQLPPVESHPAPIQGEPAEHQPAPVDTAQYKSRGGRPCEYEWGAMFGELIRVADEDNLPEKQADLTRYLLSWFEHHYGKQPAESAVKQRVSVVYRVLRAARDMKARNPAE